MYRRDLTHQFLRPTCTSRRPCADDVALKRKNKKEQPEQHTIEKEEAGTKELRIIKNELH